MKKAVIALYVIIFFQSIAIVVAFSLLSYSSVELLKGFGKGFTKTLIEELDQRYVLKSNQ